MAGGIEHIDKFVKSVRNGKVDTLHIISFWSCIMHHATNMMLGLIGENINDRFPIGEDGKDGEIPVHQGNF